MGDLTKNFDTSEFICSCGCGLFNMDMSFIDTLQDVRDEIQEPILPTSGCRCIQKNKDLDGKPASLHLEGKAVDIYIKNNTYRYFLVASLFKHGITRIYVYRDHIHIDIKEVEFPVLGWGG